METKDRERGNTVFPPLPLGPNKAARCEPAGRKPGSCLGEGNPKHVDSHILDGKLVTAIWEKRLLGEGGPGEAGVCVKGEATRSLRACVCRQKARVCSQFETGLVPTCDSISAHQRFGRGAGGRSAKAGI